MKKILQFSFAILAVAIILQACSTGKALVGASNGRMTGTWTLTNVSYDGILPNAVQNVFNEARPEAFVNSTWKLTGSGNGSYTLTNGTMQTIFWSYNDQNKSMPLFQFKKIYQGEKAKDIAEGYQLEIVQVAGNSMTLKSPIVVGSKTAYIVYAFSKQ